MDITTVNRGRRTSLRGFQEDLLEEGLLRLKPLEKKYIRELILEEFIYKFLKDYNNRINTVYVTTEDVQTEPGRRRSGGDIFRICKHYYPTTTLEEVMKILDGLAGDNGIISSMCAQINKRTYRYEESEDTDDGMTGIVYGRDIKDEFNRKPGEYLEDVIGE